jgi:hypothetical protein
MAKSILPHSMIIGTHFSPISAKRLKLNPLCITLRGITELPNFLMLGLALTDVQEILGHHGATTTDLYLQSLRNSVKKAIEKLED